MAPNEPLQNIGNSTPLEYIRLSTQPVFFTNVVASSRGDTFFIIWLGTNSGCRERRTRSPAKPGTSAYCSGHAQRRNYCPNWQRFIHPNKIILFTTRVSQIGCLRYVRPSGQLSWTQLSWKCIDSLRISDFFQAKQASTTAWNQRGGKWKQRTQKIYNRNNGALS